MPCKGMKGLKQHLAKTHADINRSITCQDCGKTFRHKHALKFHVRQVHERATRVICKICNRSVYNKYMIPRHMKVYHKEVFIE